MNTEKENRMDEWDEIEYGLYTIASEATTLLKRLNQLRASVWLPTAALCEHICVHCEEEREKE
jgi:hypothetical protein|tara:strand:+ start:1294 stop:1482 length:189 start_codon:yes stop_codon:yes gene_type:complete